MPEALGTRLKGKANSYIDRFFDTAADVLVRENEFLRNHLAGSRRLWSAEALIIGLVRQNATATINARINRGTCLG